MDLAELREQHRRGGLSESDIRPDPIAEFNAWYATWRGAAVEEPDAMIVATATPDGRPSARTVLLRGVSDDGFVFFANYRSRKGQELAANPWATLLFPWHLVGRQVIVEGGVDRLSTEASDAYWATRPRGSQLAAWASPQSQLLADREALDRRYREVVAQYRDQDIPRPEHWGGFIVRPERIELWQGRDHRLHDRLVYCRDPTVPTGWRLQRLAP